MRAPLRAKLRSESGATSPGTLIGFGIAAFVVYLLLGATQADSARYGSAPVPSKSSVELKAGDVQVYYRQNTSTGSPFTQPDNLSFGVADGQGNPLKTTVRGADPKESDGETSELIGSVSVPDDGVYSVIAGGAPVSGTVSPEVTFGESPFGAIKDRFKDSVDSLKGSTGVLVAVVVIMILLYPRIRQAMKPPRETY